MKKITRLVPLLLGLSAINLAVVFASSPQKAEAVTPSNWATWWGCNIDGRSGLLKLRLSGSQIVGTFSGNSGPDVPIVQRNFDPSSDPPTARRDHVLPLLYNGKEKWFLIMHTWDQRYASGFTRWQGSVYGINCFHH